MSRQRRPSVPESSKQKSEDFLQKWACLSSGEALNTLKSKKGSGLTARIAKLRQKRYGYNRIVGPQRAAWLGILARQFLNTLVIILGIAVLISLFNRHITDAITILAILFLNAIIGFIQEFRAEKSLQALKKMLVSQAMVIRGGKELLIDAVDLVPGDIVLLRAGDSVPADIRVLEAVNLQINEAALTGESIPSKKSSAALSKRRALIPLADQKSLLFMGSSVTNGTGIGLVIAIGNETELGRIAQMTRNIKKKKTPLACKFEHFARVLAFSALIIVILMVLIGLLQKRDFVQLILNATSLAVAAVPEGLPTVITITMALGVYAMAKKNALIKRLNAAETIGGCSVICTDKTGTLTKGEMTVTELHLVGQPQIEVTGIGYNPVGRLVFSRPEQENKNIALTHLLRASCACNDSRLIQNEKQEWQAIGDPTEVALLALAGKSQIGIIPEESEKLTELSFNSDRKRMTVLLSEQVEGGQEFRAYSKGAPEVILARSTHFMKADGLLEPLSDQDRREIEKKGKNLATSGKRILALATKRIDNQETAKGSEILEEELTFLGLVGIIDPARPEVSRAIQAAHRAGIATIMITGDNRFTAVAIANSIGFKKPKVLSSTDISDLKDSDLAKKICHGTIFARVNPEDKLRIINLLQEKGELVAMTGDGVNDALALKRADIGIAMGQTGTDVAKESADVILLDDNYATIVKAVKEGRRQFGNIKKFVGYLLSSNFAEIITIFANLLLGGPLILIPAQILWMNLITDGLSAIALGFESSDDSLMEHSPVDYRSNILNRSYIIQILIFSAYMSLITLGLYYFYQPNGRNHIQTIAFTGLIIAEKVNLFNFRSQHRNLSDIGFFTNPLLLGAVSLTILLQIGAVYLPFMQKILHTEALRLADWLVIIGASLPLLVATEIYKRFKKVKIKRSQKFQ